jgi:phosphoglucomutase
MDYILSTHREKETLPDRAVVMKTIVTSELHSKIAAEHGVPCLQTLTGFKYMGQAIREFEAAKAGPQYVYGSEESYGYLVGTSVRDKDAVSAAVLTAELTLYHKSEGRSLLDALKQLFQKHGYHQEMLVTRQFPGQEGFAQMVGLMEQLREKAPEEWAGTPVVEIRDYQEGQKKDLVSGGKEPLEFPNSNVLQWILEDGSVVTARPSGTEPKIKFYASCFADPGVNQDQARSEVDRQIRAIEKQVDALL